MPATSTLRNRSPYILSHQNSISEKEMEENDIADFFNYN